MSINRNNILVVETLSPRKVEATAISKESMLEEFADVFAGEGKLEGDLYLEIDPSVTPVQCGETTKEAHDSNLRNLLQRCREKGVKLNSGKVQLRRKEVSYMGHTLTEEGLKPDACKVKAVQEKPPPKDKRAVQRLLGMTNYLQRFAPKLSEVTNPLRELTKKESKFIWDESTHGLALAETKRILSAALVLRYFDPAITPVLQCDTSMHGLGACLMEDGQPVAYASRSLTDTEVNYVQIKKELLAIVFGMENFETYVYGRKVMVESDHKPLETIFKKSFTPQNVFSEY